MAIAYARMGNVATAEEYYKKAKTYVYSNGASVHALARFADAEAEIAKATQRASSRPAR